MVTTRVSSRERATTSNRARRIAFVLILGVALIASVLALRWRSHVEVFQDAGNEMGMLIHPGPGQAAVVGMTYPRDDENNQRVTVTAARPNVVVNTADATFKVQICVRRAGVGAISADDLRNLGQYCAHVVPAKGASMWVRGARPDQVIVTVTPRRPGTVRLRGLHLTYSHGWHHGSQNTGFGFVLRVR
jgi:hypothetical protein